MMNSEITLAATAERQDGPVSRSRALVAPLHISKYSPSPGSTSSSFSSAASTATTSSSLSTSSSNFTEPELEFTYKPSAFYNASLSRTSSLQNLAASTAFSSQLDAIYDSTESLLSGDDGGSNADDGLDEGDDFEADVEYTESNFPNFLRAFHAFTPSSPVSSTGAESSITVQISVGDLILVHSIHHNGWADGTLLPSGARGWLPTNYCEPYDHDAISPLLSALIHLWDLISAVADGGLAAFGRDDYVRAMIAGVRIFLEKTDCLNRDSDLVVEHVGVRVARKGLLGDLTNFVRMSKQVRLTVESGLRGDLLTPILDSLVLHAAKVVTRTVGFLDIWEAGWEDPTDLQIDRRDISSIDTTMVRSSSSDLSSQIAHASNSDLAEGNESSDPLSPESSATRMRRFKRNKSNAPLQVKTSTESSPRGLASFFPGSSSTTSGGSSRFSPTGGSSFLSWKRSGSQRTASHRLSATVQINEDAPYRASRRLAMRHDAFLGCLGSFIGGHLQARSAGELVTATEQSVAAGRQLIWLVETISARDPRLAGPLEQACELLDSRLVELVQATKHVFTLSATGTTILVPDYGNTLINAAAGCVRAAGEAVGKARSVVERVGDFDLDPIDRGSTPVVTRVVTPQSRPVPVPQPTAPSSPEKPLPRPPSSRSVKASPERVLKPLPQLPTGLDAIPTRWRPNPTAPPLIRRTTSNSSTRSYGSTRPTPVISTTSPSNYTSVLTPRDEVMRHVPLTVKTKSDTSQPTSPQRQNGNLRIITQPSTSDSLGLGYPLTPVSRSPSVKKSGHSTSQESLENRLSVKTYAHELVFHKNGHVVGGSLPSLVERLTTHDAIPDGLFVSTFFLTFRVFTSPLEFAQALVDRFEYVGANVEIARLVRPRIYNVFKGWLEVHWNPSADEGALFTIHTFAVGLLTRTLPAPARRLCELTVLLGGGHVEGREPDALTPAVSSLHRNMSAASGLSLLSGSGGSISGGGFFANAATDRSIPSPIMTRSQASSLRSVISRERSPSYFGVADIDPLETARQITLMASRLLCAIEPSELVGCAWIKKDGKGTGVKAMASFSNDLNACITDSILRVEEPRRRAGVIRYWLKVGQRCLDLDNYDSLMQIVCVLSSTVILRLRRTWEHISSRTMNKLEAMKRLFDVTKNHAVMRKLLQGKTAPCVPFLGMYLTDLTFIEAGNTDIRPGTVQSDSKIQPKPLINFGKHVQTGKVISTLQAFQAEPYRLIPVDVIQEFFEDTFATLDSHGYEKTAQGFYQRSLDLEPRDPVPEEGGDVTEVSPTTETPPATTPLTSTARSLEFLGRHLGAAFSGGDKDKDK